MEKATSDQKTSTSPVEEALILSPDLLSQKQSGWKQEGYNEEEIKELTDMLERLSEISDRLKELLDLGDVYLKANPEIIQEIKDLQSEVEAIKEYREEIRKEPSSKNKKTKSKMPEKYETEAWLKAFEQKTLDEIERLLLESTDSISKMIIAENLVGLDSDRAWEMREQLLAEGSRTYYIFQGLTGLDSDRAWKIRKQLLNERDKNDRFDNTINFVAMSLVGDYVTFVWRLLLEKKNDE